MFNTPDWAGSKFIAAWTEGKERLLYVCKLLYQVITILKDSLISK